MKNAPGRWGSRRRDFRYGMRIGLVGLIAGLLPPGLSQGLALDAARGGAPNAITFLLIAGACEGRRMEPPPTLWAPSTEGLPGRDLPGQKRNGIGEALASRGIARGTDSGGRRSPGAAHRSPPAGFSRICRRFAGMDIDGDGRAEIVRLREWKLSGVPPQPNRPLVMILLEERLLESTSKTGERLADIRPAIRRYGADLVDDGWDVRVAVAGVASGTGHRDGRTVLALRRFFQAVKQDTPTFAGVVMIGSFPEAFLVRRVNWRKNEAITLRAKHPDKKVFKEKIPFLRSVPEPVADRCELVLCDLDGRWEEVYVEPKERLSTVIGIYPNGVPKRGGPCTDFERGGVTFEDFFYVNDGHLDVRELVQPGPAKNGKRTTDITGLDIRILDDCANGECSAVDARRPNPLACPDIVVSRIDARHVALRPKTSVVGVDGQGLLDADGRPRTVTFADEKAVPRWLSVWERDAGLERRLLREYFDRNHAFRTGAFADQDLPAAIGYGLGDGFDRVRGASPHWTSDAGGGRRGGAKASLLEYVEWLKRPACLREIQAHSDPWGSTFGRCDLKKLLEAAGGQPWTWSKEGCSLVPSLRDACKGGKADFALYRTLWENRVLPDMGVLYMHMGCQAISPGGAGRLPYDHPDYGYWQGAESLLFYAQGLALIGRAKVFYDWPRGFYASLRAGETFGRAWTQYFERESEAKNLAEVGGDIGRKRAYFWSVLGDWTLRLPGTGKRKASSGTAAE